MAWKPDYCSASELKAHLRITDAADDTAIGICITAASRAIDKACNRQFGSAAQTRVYQWGGEYANGRPAVAIDDLMTTTSLVVKLEQQDDGTYTNTLTYQTDFDLWPLNAAADGEPWTHILFRSAASVFPIGAYAELQVAGTFGWTAVPTIVKEACLLQAARFFVRRDSQYGIAGSPEVGTELRLLERLDPDVAVALAPVRRWWGAV